MRLACGLILLLAAVAAASDVIVLTPSNFDSVVNPEETMLVEFYAPWCGHCKRLAPEYEKAATALKGKVPLGKVDCDEHRPLCSRFGVSGYPTLKVFKSGEQNEYGGGREEDTIVSYMKKQSGPAAKPAASMDDLQAIMDEENYNVIGLFPSSSSSKPSRLNSAFLIVASRLRNDFSFVKTDAEDVYAKFGVPQGEEALLVVRAGGDSGDADVTLRYEGSSTTVDVIEFIKENSVPLVGVLNDDTKLAYASRGMPTLKVYAPSVTGKMRRYYTNRVIKTAEKYRDSLVVLLASSQEHSTSAGNVGVSGTDVGVVIEDGQDLYKLEGEAFSAKAVDAFAAAWKSGEAEKYVKSEPVPEDNDGPVTVLVGRNFESIVLDEDKDVLVEFYAPWCGHCKSLAPTYEKLGKKFAKDNGVVIAKIDATANDYPRDMFAVSGFPTMYFVPAKAGADPVKYDGGRDLSDLVKFVKKSRKSKKKRSKRKGKSDGGKKKRRRK